MRVSGDLQTRARQNLNSTRRAQRQRAAVARGSIAGHARTPACKAGRGAAHLRRGRGGDLDHSSTNNGHARQEGPNLLGLARGGHDDGLRRVRHRDGNAATSEVRPSPPLARRRSVSARYRAEDERTAVLASHATTQQAAQKPRGWCSSLHAGRLQSFGGFGGVAHPLGRGLRCAVEELLHDLRRDVVLDLPGGQRAVIPLRKEQAEPMSGWLRKKQPNAQRTSTRYSVTAPRRRSMMRVAEAYSKPASKSAMTSSAMLRSG